MYAEDKTTQAIENYYGIGVSQCSDVLWVSNTKVAAHIWGSYGYNSNCCQFAVTAPPLITVPDESWQCNFGNTLDGTGGVGALMAYHGTGTAYVGSTLANALAVQTEMNAGRPFMMDVGRPPAAFSPLHCSSRNKRFG